MLNDECKTLIRHHSAGMVATVNEDGTPAVSPKATFVVVDDSTIAFGDIRSPGTVANLKRDPGVEVCFIDVVYRKAVRVRGAATVIPTDEASDTLIAAFEELWGPYLPTMANLVQIDIASASMITSPAYDMGHTPDDLRKVNLEKLNLL